jgi:hypothetical protein
MRCEYRQQHGYYFHWDHDWSDCFDHGLYFYRDHLILLSLGQLSLFKTYFKIAGWRKSAFYCHLFADYNHQFYGYFTTA